MVQQSALGLFLDPGLGKTSIVLAAFKILKKAGYVNKLLIIAPVRPMYFVWPAEIEKWASFNGLTYTILHGKDKNDRLQDDVDVYLINPEGLKWLLGKPNHPQWDAVAVDESTKFKNSQSQRFKLMRNIWGGVSRRWILTGSPSPNGLEDLFGQMYILDGGNALGRYITHFRNKFYIRGYNDYEWEPKDGAFKEIVERIAPLVLQLDAEDHLKMPKLLDIVLPVALPSKARQLYNEIENEFFTLLEGDVIMAPNSAVAGGKCRQIANGAVYNSAHDWHQIHDVKLDALEDLLEELNGKPLLLLYEFQHDMHRIQERFGTEENPIPVLGAGVSMKKADAYIKRFNAGDFPFMMGHPASMGHGLNLQGGCHHVCWFGITWNFEYYDQSIRRVYRQGQEGDTVYNYHIVATDTLDETVMEVLVAKERTQDKLQRAVKERREGCSTLASA